MHLILCPFVIPICCHATIFTYHVDKQRCFSKCSCSCSCSCSCLRSCDCRNDDWQSNLSSCPHCDTNNVNHYDVDHSTANWNTYPYENPYHPIHFDDHGNCINPITATDKPNDPDFESSEESYISKKPPADAPPDFDIHNYTDHEVKNTVIDTTSNLMNSPKLSYFIAILPAYIVWSKNSMMTKPRNTYSIRRTVTIVPLMFNAA